MSNQFTITSSSHHSSHVEDIFLGSICEHEHITLFDADTMLPSYSVLISLITEEDTVTQEYAIEALTEVLSLQSIQVSVVKQCTPVL